MVCLVPLSIVLRKVKAGYKLGKKEGKVNHLLFIDILKLYGKIEKELKLLVNIVRIFSEDIMVEFGISECVMLMMKTRKVHYK